MAPDNPLWLALTVAAFALSALAWMARAHLREWKAYKAGTLLPRGCRPPEPPALHPPWRWRFLWLYAAQALAFGRLTCGMINDIGPKQAVGHLAMNTTMVAFATAVLTRLWDRATALV